MEEVAAPHFDSIRGAAGTIFWTIFLFLFLLVPLSADVAVIAPYSLL
jgi:hypothetical protein